MIVEARSRLDSTELIPTLLLGIRILLEIDPVGKIDGSMVIVMVKGSSPLPSGEMEGD